MRTPRKFKEWQKTISKNWARICVCTSSAGMGLKWQKNIPHHIYTHALNKLDYSCTNISWCILPKRKSMVVKIIYFMRACCVFNCGCEMLLQKRIPAQMAVVVVFKFVTCVFSCSYYIFICATYTLTYVYSVPRMSWCGLYHVIGFVQWQRFVLPVGTHCSEGELIFQLNVDSREWLRSA